MLILPGNVIKNIVFKDTFWHLVSCWVCYKSHLLMIDTTRGRKALILCAFNGSLNTKWTARRHMKVLPHRCFNPASRFCTLESFDDELPWHTFNMLTQRNWYKNRIQLERSMQRNVANSVKRVDILHPFYWFFYHVSYISSQPEDKRRPSYDIMRQKARRLSPPPIILC